MDSRIQLHDWVLIQLASSTKSIVGTVAFVGETEFSVGNWLGLILVPECRKFAKNNGVIQGKQYFTLPDNEKKSDLNFGIFVRPEKVQLLYTNSLIALSDISNTTKIHLLVSKLSTLESDYNNIISEFEKVQVEYDQVLFDHRDIVVRYDEMNIEYQALKSLQVNHNSSSLEDEKLKVENEQLKLLNEAERAKYSEIVESLESDIKMLESKLQMQSKDLNQDLLNEVNDSEEIVEKLTIENNLMNERLHDATSKLQALSDHLTEYKSTIDQLQKSNAEYQDQIKQLQESLNSKTNLLNLEHEKYALVNDELSKLKSTHDYSSTGLYSKLISSLQISSNNFVSITEKTNPKIVKALKLYRNVLQLYQFTNVILEFEKSPNWILLNKQLDLLINLLPYDTNHSLLKYEQYIEPINTLILHYLEVNDEMNDSNLLLSISTEIPHFDVSTFDGFEEPLLNRELAIYYLTDDKENLIDDIKQLREDEHGINILTIESFLLTGTYDKVKLSKQAYWVENEDLVTIVDSSEVDNLKLKIKLLQSKLLDEKQFQHQLIEIQTHLQNSEFEKQELTVKLEKSSQHKSELTNEIGRINQKLMKYGINDTSSTIDEYKILEKKRLLDTINYQRSLLSKFTSTKNTYKYPIPNIQRKKQYASLIPSSIYRRIDKLLEINTVPLSSSSNNHSFKEQQILEYLNLY